MLQETQDGDGLAVERIAALDIGKAEVACCVRVPSPSGKGRRAQEVATYSTMTRSLHALADQLRALRVSRVVMEATSDYWKPVFYLLEAAEFEVWLVTASATAAWPAAAARRKRSSPSAAPCSWSSGTSSPTPTPNSSTSVPTTTTPGPAPNAPSATTSLDYKPSATPSPSPQPPEPCPSHRRASSRLRRHCRMPS
jgi:Transposase